MLTRTIEPQRSPSTRGSVDTEHGSQNVQKSAPGVRVAPSVEADAMERNQTPGFLSLLEPMGRVFQRSAAPTSLAREAMQAAAKVTGEYILFTPPEGQAPSRGLVFLGGAKVQEESYAPLAKALAERGIAVSIVRSPFDLPFLISLRGRRVEEAARALRALEPNLSLMVGGHSAGGFVATNLRGIAADDVLLVNARAQSRSPRPDISGLAVFGERDGLISPEERQQTERALPAVGTVVIEDLDHDFAQGLYGRQDGDPVTEGSTEALVKRVADVIAERLGRPASES